MVAGSDRGETERDTEDEGFAQRKAIIQDLPSEMLSQILLKLDYITGQRCRRVCHEWKEVLETMPRKVLVLDLVMCDTVGTLNLRNSPDERAVEHIVIEGTLHGH